MSNRTESDFEMARDIKVSMMKVREAVQRVQKIAKSEGMDVVLGIARNFEQ